MEGKEQEAFQLAHQKHPSRQAGVYSSGASRVISEGVLWQNWRALVTLIIDLQIFNFHTSKLHHLSDDCLTSIF
jgi:hypothetical protein